MLAGDKPAICITEPDAGSAATEMTTRADKRGDKFIINGAKHWITGGGVSKLHVVFARVFDEDGQELGIGGFIAERDKTPGLRVGQRELTMGLRDSGNLCPFREHGGRRRHGDPGAGGLQGAASPA